jgi:hypothetical protein
VREGCFFFFFFFFFFSCMGRRRRGHTQHSMLQQAVLSWLAWEDKGCPPPVHRAVRPSVSPVASAQVAWIEKRKKEKGEEEEEEKCGGGGGTGCREHTQVQTLSTMN